MGFTVERVTWEGPKADDAPLLKRLPEDLRWLLSQACSGYLQFDGALHIRGAVKQPAWHSLRSAWLGKHALHRAFDSLRGEDIPFAQDYLGNQFIWRDGMVCRMDGETGHFGPVVKGVVSLSPTSGIESEPAAVRFEVFLNLVQRPELSLDMRFLDAWREAGHELEPGQLMHVYPPLCSREARARARLHIEPMAAATRLAFLARSARHVALCAAGEDPSFPTLK